MSVKDRDRVGRRDFMTRAVVAVGASALAGGEAAAQAATLTQSEASGSGSLYTGEVVQGKKVVSRLDVADLEPGRKHALYFKGVQAPGGQPWHVSVLVAKGARPGKRFVLTSGVHGDEMSSIRAVQAVMAQLDPAQMSGTVMA